MLQGKTEAVLAGNSMLGFYARSLWTGDCTKSAMYERLHQQTDLPVAVDDVVVCIFPCIPDTWGTVAIGASVLNQQMQPRSFNCSCYDCPLKWSNSSHNY